MPLKTSSRSDGARIASVLALALACRILPAQQPQAVATATRQPAATTLPSGIDRLAGTEPASQIKYVRLMLNGSLHPAPNGLAEPATPTPPPILIAQCTLRPNGKYMFEIFASFGGAVDLGFHPPWKPSGPNDRFPPRSDKFTITMDFLGYTHVKPVRKQWEIAAESPALCRYNPPGFGSSNLEEVSFYLKYLLSLPTLRLTLDTRAVEFVTTPLLNEIRKEPLCRAAAI
jgi:hypothetical protein